MISQLLPGQRVLLPSELVHTQPAKPNSHKSLLAVGAEKIITQDITLRQKLQAGESRSEPVQSCSTGTNASEVPANQRMLEQTEAYQSVVRSHQQIERMLASRDEDLQQSTTMLAQAQADLAYASTQLEDLQNEHTYLLCIAQRATTLLDQDMPSTFELLSELDHQYTKNQLLERMFAHCLDSEIFGGTRQTLNYLESWRQNIRVRLGVARVIADSEMGVGESAQHDPEATIDNSDSW